MKVLHVIDSAGVYGAEKMLLNLMEEHRRMGLQPVLLSIREQNGRDGGGLDNEAAVRGLQSLGIFMNRGYSLKSAFRIMRLARENSVDIIHSHGYKGNILLGSLPRSVRKIPIISTAHGWTATDRFSRIWFYVLLDKFFLKRMDAVVNVNSAVRPVAGVSESFVVENGIQELKFDADSCLRSDPEVRDFCSTGFIIGAICRLSQEKGLVHLVEALRLLAKKSDDFKAIIIGDGPEKERLLGLIRGYGLTDKVLLTGYRNNAHNYLPLFSVFALPSLTEGLPITLLEAMQAGVPVVATRVGGVPDVLKNSGSGAAVEPANPQELADAILSLRNNPSLAGVMAKRARDAVLMRYSSQRMAEDYLKVYEAVLNRWKR